MHSSEVVFTASVGGWSAVVRRKNFLRLGTIAACRVVNPKRRRWVLGDSFNTMCMHRAVNSKQQPPPRLPELESMRGNGNTSLDYIPLCYVIFDCRNRSIGCERECGQATPLHLAVCIGGVCGE